MNDLVKSASTGRMPHLVAAFLCALLLPVAVATAEEKVQVAVPAFNDKYSMLVKKLESGQTEINYREFRESFLESKQFQVAASRRSEYDRLRAALPDLMAQSSFPKLVQTTKKILSIDYTNMRAHKILYQTYKVLKDESNRKKYHDIEFGLLNSIVKNGDGKSCQTAWPVVQIEEEYFILEMLGAKLTRQSIDNKGGLCDKMEVSTDEGKATYYFGIAKIFEARSKSLEGK
jgi:Domain of unknown function (DUF4919)